MKKKVFLLSILCVFMMTTLCGCGKNLESASVTRDEARTGGSLSFVYDKENRSIYIGGEGEVIQYSSADESRGLGEGCRVGFKVTAPNEELDLTTAKMEMNGVNYSAPDFLESIDGQLQRFFYLYPSISKEDEKVEFCVTWQDGAKEQCYKIFVVEGTKFMDKDGNVE